MNYSELVTSKTPQVYVSYDNGSSSPIIGQTSYTNTSYLNPTFDTIFKKFGTRCKKAGQSGSGSYDVFYYNITGGQVYPSRVTYYFHQEFWIYFTTNPGNTTQIGGFSYANLSPAGTFTSTATSLISTALKVQFGTANNTGGESHTLTSNASIPIGQWVHIAMQYDYGIKRIYINGVLDIELDTGFIGGVGSIYREPGSSARVTTYFDELAIWANTTTTKPANFPTEADILQRVNFPKTKTKFWNATSGYWVESGDEKYWNGTQWVSMQELPYKVWNGTEWVAL